MCWQIFTECCPTCTRALPRKVNTAGHQPILTKGFGNRGQVRVLMLVCTCLPLSTHVHVLLVAPQVDLIDFQSCPDGEYKFLLNYQDHGVKIYDNRPLTHKTVMAVAHALLDIFSTIGPPCTTQLYNMCYTLCNTSVACVMHYTRITHV